MNKLTQIKLFEGSGYQGFGPLGLEGTPNADAGVLFQTFISSAIGLISIIAIIWFIFILLSGAISLITSAGDKAAAENAKKRITNGLIGLIVAIFGIFVLTLVGEIFGIKAILNIPYLLGNLKF